MTPAQIILAIQVLEQGMHLVLSAGLAVDTLLTDIRDARSRGTVLTDAQIDAYAKRAADAVERL